VHDSLKVKESLVKANPHSTGDPWPLYDIVINNIKLFCRSHFIDAAVSEAVLGVWLHVPLPTPRALPDHGALWPLAVGVEKDFGRYRCLTLRYSLLLSVWVDPSAEHRYSIHCNAGGRGETILCAIVGAMKGGSGVPKQRWCLQRIVLIRAHTPPNQTIFCKGQGEPHTYIGTYNCSKGLALTLCRDST